MTRSAQDSNLSSSVFSPVPHVQVLRALFVPRVIRQNLVWLRNISLALLAYPRVRRAFTMTTLYASHAQLSVKHALMPRHVPLARLMHQASLGS